MLRLFGLVAVGALVAGCAPQVGPDDWTLEPIPFQSAIGRTDFAFGMQGLAADGSGGFWARSGETLLHVGVDGETLAMPRSEDDRLLAGGGAIAALSGTELVVTRNERAPVLSVIDTTTMTVRDLPREPAVSNDDFGDFAFGDIAVHDGDAIVVRYQPRSTGYLDYQLLRVDLDDGARTLLYTAPLSLQDAPDAFPGVPPVDLDVDAEGRIYLATPSARIVLDAEGAELSAHEQAADHPRVAVGPSGRHRALVGRRARGVKDPGRDRGRIVRGERGDRPARELRQGRGVPHGRTLAERRRGAASAPLPVRRERRRLDRRLLGGGDRRRRRRGARAADAAREARLKARRPGLDKPDEDGLGSSTHRDEPGRPEREELRT